MTEKIATLVGGFFYVNIVITWRNCAFLSDFVVLNTEKNTGRVKIKLLNSLFNTFVRQGDSMKALLFSFVLLFSFEASTNVQVEPKELFAKKRDVRADSPGCKSIKSTKEKKRGYKIKSAGTSLNKYEDKRYVKGFYCHQCKENAKSDGPIKLKNDLVWEHTSNGDKVKDDITANHYKCTEVVNKYVCFIKNGGKRVKAVKVGSTKHTNLSSSDNHTVGKVEYSSKADAKAETGAKTKECVPAEEKFVCYIKNGGKRVKAVKVGSTKHTNLSSSDKHIVGKVEYASKADAKEEKGAETKECVEGKTETEYACYFCDPGATGKAVSSSYGPNNRFEVVKNWDPVTHKDMKGAIVRIDGSHFVGKGRKKFNERKFNKINSSDKNMRKYRHIIKIITKPELKRMYTAIKQNGAELNFWTRLKESINKSRVQFVACEREGVDRNKAIDNAVAYTLESKICHGGTEKDCNDYFPGKGLGASASNAKVISGDFKTAVEMEAGVATNVGNSVMRTLVNNPNASTTADDGTVSKIYEFKDRASGVSCYAKAKFRPEVTKKMCGNSTTITEEEGVKAKKVCNEIKEEITTAKWDQEKCRCNLPKMKFDKKFDSCEYEFEQQSFNKKIELGGSNKATREVAEYNEIMKKANALLKLIKVNADLHHNCTLEVAGQASNNGLKENCVRYINNKSKTNFTEQDYDKGEAGVINDELGRLRAESFVEYLKSNSEDRIGSRAQCTVEYCGATAKEYTDPNRPEARKDQLFDVTYTCEDF